MTTSTETPTNQHQPITEEHRITCAAPDCGSALHTYNPPSGTIDWPAIFRSQHAAQYDVGRAPDITVNYAIEALCSVCADIGSVKMCEDGDRVCCGDCGTHWSMHGTDGELEEHSDADDPILEEQPAPTSYALTCGSCNATAEGVRAAMDHIRDHPDHNMAGTIDAEGTTVRVGVNLDEQEDDD